MLAALVGLDPFFDPADGGRLPAWDGGLLPVSGFGDLAEVGRELGLAEVGLDPALEPGFAEVGLDEGFPDGGLEEEGAASLPASISPEIGRAHV